MLSKFLQLIICGTFLVNLSCSESSKITNTAEVLTSDGAWCWFSDPRAIYTHNEESKIITGWVTSDGSIETAVLNLGNGSSMTKNCSPKIDKDDHANPAFLETGSAEALMFYTKHFDANVRVHNIKYTDDSLYVEDVALFPPFNEAQFKLYPRKGVTYANPFSLSSEGGRIYCFGRWTGYKPNMMWSDDKGKSFGSAQVYITNKPFNDDNRPYVKYYSDGKSKIHIVFTDGHPRKEPQNSVYYACYESGAFWKADGSKICDLENIPFEPKEASIIYKADSISGRGWIYDIAANEKGNPVVLYARYPKETEHNYYYAAYNGEEWIDNKICYAGKWFPQTPADGHEREPHYSGGLTVNPLEPNHIFLAREINGIFEIEKRITEDAGKTWSIIPVTENSTYDNVRPYVPRNMKQDDPEVVLWMENKKYIHYTDYQTSIKYQITNK